ncbi:hemerythrin domain-containing protein [Ideonella sp. YS5]|uniref:hemerythrin domain-containing protein n=1 Tax=Ideonella sp. YS5 TaxID=3453714 RepID=UPI003EEC2346
MPDRCEDEACDLLDADHLAVKHLFVEYARLAYAAAAPAGTYYAAAPDEDVDDAKDNRATIATTICDELSVHAQIEEEIFYPALRQAVPSAADVLDEAEQEHAQAKALIAQIRQLSTADSTMDGLMADLARAIEDHVKEERDELFPKARAAAGLDLAELGTRLKQRQQALEQQATKP